jgi:molybdenum cofactor cytidylyltransferase
MKISAILLAAGLGTRFGGGKLLHPLSDGVALGAHAARNLIAAGLEVIAVVKPGDDSAARMLDGEGCRVTICARAARGMGASLACGVAASGDAAGWVIALADMPAVRSATIAMVVRELKAGLDLVAPIYQGKRGHPVGFGKRFEAQLLALDGDAGARDIITAHKSELRLVECDDPGILLDIDRREELQK